MSQPHPTEEARYDRGSIFWFQRFLNDGLLNPKSSEFQSCVAVCRVVRLSHGIVQWVALLFSSKISTSVNYGAPQVRSFRKKVVHLYRSMPRKALKYTACCIRAGGIFAANVRCAHRSVRVVVHTACLCGWLFLFCFLDFSFFFERPRDFGEINKTRTSTSSKLCTAYDTCIALLKKKNAGARDSLYYAGLLPSSHPVVDASAKAPCNARSSASFGFQR